MAVTYIEADFFDEYYAVARDETPFPTQLTLAEMSPYFTVSGSDVTIVDMNISYRFTHSLGKTFIIGEDSYLGDFSSADGMVTLSSDNRFVIAGDGNGRFTLENIAILYPSSGGSVTCDLSTVEAGINTIISAISSLTHDVDMNHNVIADAVSAIGSQIDSKSLAIVEALTPAISSYPSLNGDGSEFVDGSTVNVNGREGRFIVSRSFYSMVSDSAYTVVYDLLGVDSAVKLTVPESLLTAVVETVPAP